MHNTKEIKAVKRTIEKNMDCQAVLFDQQTEIEDLSDRNKLSILIDAYDDYLTDRQSELIDLLIYFLSDSDPEASFLKKELLKIRRERSKLEKIDDAIHSDDRRSIELTKTLNEKACFYLKHSNTDLEGLINILTNKVKEALDLPPGTPLPGGFQQEKGR